MFAFMMYVLNFFDPTASAMAYGRRPKFVMAEHSATAEGENCAYGPTLLIVLHLSYAPSSTFVEKYNKKAVEKK